MEFYELMVKAFDEVGWSQNFVSKEFNINRGLLHRFYRGISSISRENFKAIINKIPISLSEKKVLTEKFYKENLGGDTFRRVIQIRNVLREIAEEQRGTLSEYRITPIEFSDLEKVNVLGYSQIKAAVDYIFKNVAPCKIYTNYPFSFTEFDNAVFSNYMNDRNWDIMHMIIFKTDGEDEENIYSLFRSFRWAEYRTTPYYVISGGNRVINCAYPCFFAADSNCLFFNPRNKRGFFIKNDEMFECVREVSEEFMKDASALASFPKDMFDLKNECCRISNERIEMSISNNPCIASIINEESISNVIRSDIPDSESLKKIAADHYEKLAANSEQKYVTTDEGLRKFAESGRIIECPPVIVVDERLPIEYRKRFFEKFLSFVDRGRGLIIDSKAFIIPNISIELGENNIQLFCTFRDFPENMRYCGNAIINLNDKRLRKDMELFIEYIQANGGVYSKEMSVDYLKVLLALCDGREKTKALQ